MRMLSYAKRTTKEILRDPLSLIFGLGFPVMLILILSAIQSNIPVSIFEIESLAPGMTIFGLSFMTLFSAQLISKDRESTFLQRLYASPMTAMDFILGYTLPILPLAIIQALVCFLVSIPLGLPVTGGIIRATLSIIPSALFFIGMGLLCGSVLNSKQAGGLCGALLTNLTAFLSGIWIDLELIGGVFEKIAYMLPFVHSVELERLAYAGVTEGLAEHLIWVLGYALAAIIVAVLLFLRQMKNN